MPDPDSILNPLFASDSPNNFMQYHDPVVDELLKLAQGNQIQAKLDYQLARAELGFMMGEEI